MDEIKLSAVDICHLRKFDSTPGTESWWLESVLNEFEFSPPHLRPHRRYKTSQY